MTENTGERARVAARDARVVQMLREGASYDEICEATGVYRTRISTLKSKFIIGKPNAVQPPCSVDDCDRPRKSSSGYCNTHNLRQLKYGKTELPTRPDFATAFWAKVTRGPDCWLWTGARNAEGYGSVGIRVDGRPSSRGAHRIAYELHYDEVIPAGLTIDHLCRNPSCVNPEHLEVVTQRINNLRNTSPVTANALKTHCKRGHPLSGPNMYLKYRKYGPQRNCHKCDAIRVAEKRAGPAA